MSNGIFREIDELKDKIFDIESMKKPYQDEIKRKEMIISEYSIFDVDDFGYVLSCLMSRIEGEDYEYYDVRYDAKILQFNYYDFDIERDELIYHVVGNVKDKKISVSETYVRPFSSPFIKDEDIVIIGKQRQGRIDKIKLFGRYGFNIDFKNKTYIKDFVTYLIEYKVLNNVKNLSLEEMETILDAFVSDLEKNSEKVKIISKKR